MGHQSFLRQLLEVVAADSAPDDHLLISLFDGKFAEGRDGAVSQGVRRRRLGQGRRYPVQNETARYSVNYPTAATSAVQPNFSRIPDVPRAKDRSYRSYRTCSGSGQYRPGASMWLGSMAALMADVMRQQTASAST